MLTIFYVYKCDKEKFSAIFRANLETTDSRLIFRENSKRKASIYIYFLLLECHFKYHGMDENNF